jgi:hypothetical protein
MTHDYQSHQCQISNFRRGETLTVGLYENKWKVKTKIITEKSILFDDVLRNLSEAPINDIGMVQITRLRCMYSQFRDTRGGTF